MKVKTFFIRVLLFFIVFYQIAGGLLGIYSIVQKSFSVLSSQPIIYTIGVGLFGFSLFCGVKICFNKVKGIKLAIASQYLQVIQFSILGFILQYVAGAYFAIGFSDTPDYHFLFYSSFFRSVFIVVNDTDSNQIGVVINLVAVGMIFLMERLIKYYQGINLDS